ncbi:MAG: hypothetical protein M1401_20690 [Chloroflexi bacterium]|nr:hypothetical protein [Chloroflexota bacterium]
MARTVRNPDIFGEDLTDLAAEFAGIAGTAIVNDKVVAPMTSKVISFASDTPEAKALDAGGTAVAAWGLGMGVGMLNKNWGRFVKRGGIMLALVKGISIFIPGFSLTGNIPVFRLPAPAPAPAQQIAAASTSYGI